MALHAPEPPATSLAAARDGVRELAAGGSIPPLARAERGAEPVLTHPRRLYQIDRDDLLAGAALSAARPVLWRYTVELDGRAVAFADTMTTPDGSDVLAQVNYGPFVAGITEALEAAERNEGTTDAESRLLHVPALHLIAVWLHAPSGEDRLLPATPAPEGMEPGRSYPLESILPELVARARALPPARRGGAEGG
ncbi:hypothetical protein [Streptomyces sp. NPDC014894]|uniref:hypothetical protein n=1 Tax=Streptomyces sp. NPDC014894 TaxID=3364931 RepID=UPI0036F892F1